jgi:hypothetical protein
MGAEGSRLHGESLINEPATVSPFSIATEASGVFRGGQMATARPGALEGTGDLAE